MNDDSDKKPKTAVNYRDAEGRKRCHICRYFEGSKQRCWKVQGVIKPDKVCDLWRGM